MTSHTPLVSIGIPAFNEEKYLAETLESLLSQNYANLEIIISDNASTDGTRAIGEAYARKDSRIRYERSSQNIGAIANFNRAFSLSQGEYFMWAGGHDLWDPHYVQACFHELNKNPAAVMCEGELHEIDPSGKFLKIISVDLNTQGLSLPERLRKIIPNPGFCMGIYGFFRSDSLRKIGSLPEIMGFDILLSAKLSLLGEFLFVPAARLHFRSFPDRTYEADEAVMRVLSPADAEAPKGKSLRRFPSCKYMFAAIDLIGKTPLSWGEKARVTFHVLRQIKPDIVHELFIRPLPRKMRGVLKKCFG